MSSNELPPVMSYSPGQILSALELNQWGPETGSTPRASRLPSPVPSVHSIHSATSHRSEQPPHVSPTPTLAPAYVPDTWDYNGTPYATLEEAANAAAEGSEIPPNIQEWVKDCLRLFALRDVSQVYNALAGKVYEHRDMVNARVNQLEQELAESKVAIRELRVKALTAQARADTTEQRLAMLERNMSQMNTLSQTLAANDATFNTVSQHLAGEIRQLRTMATMMPSVPVPPPTQAPTHTQATPSWTGPRPRIGEPPKFKGATSDMTLENWLTRVEIWLRFQGIVTDDEKIMATMLMLEGGAHAYMDDYSTKITQSLSLGTWAEFIDRLNKGYRQLAPEKDAQAKLDEWCKKNHKTIAKFAENFRLYAFKSGYSDVELIRRIDQQRTNRIKDIVVTIEQTQPTRIPKTWEAYLDYMLSLEMNLREDQQFTRPAAPTSKDPTPMDVDALKKPEKMTKEQEDWLAAKKCFRCGKHPYKKGDRCRSPKYKGFYELPDTTPKTSVRALAETPEEEQAVHAFLEKIRRSRAEATTSQTPVPDASEHTARIVEVLNDEDFMKQLL